MASFFQYFGSSQMPKRLLRFALSKFDILDSDALDTENLDFVLGRNTVLEFRDVGINLKKLESLLQLPPSLKFQKAKASLLRISIPIDFYAGSIVIEVDGIIISLQVAGLETKRPERRATREDDTGVPNTVDLANSFLEAQPTSDRKELEEAIAAEAQDLGASVSASEDGSDDDALLGTGQTLTLPTFLAGFLQGVADRTQIRIKGVALNLDVDVAVDPSNPNTEPVSFQVALDGVDIEGVTTQVTAEETNATPLKQSKEGKRLVSLNSLRAYLISEANVFSVFAQSPSTASPSLASSPALTRNPPSRETSNLFQDQLSEAHVEPTLQQSIGSLSSRSSSSDSDSELGDSEVALGIPYNFSEEDEPQEEDGPATPRASVYHAYDESPERSSSVYHEFEGSPEQSMFHSTVLPAQQHLAQSTAFEGEVPQWASTHQESRSEPALRDLPATSGPLRAGAESPPPSWQEAPTHHTPASDSGSDSTEDLTQSHLYTHEEAESMYMSAFSDASSANPRALNQSGLLRTEGDHPPERSTSPAPVSLPPKTDASQSQPAAERQSTMPGGWDDGLDSVYSSTALSPQANTTQPAQISGEVLMDTSPVDVASPMPAPVDSSAEIPIHENTHDPEPGHEDAATPRGTTRLVKELLTLDRVSVYIPSSHQHVHVGLDSDDSVAQLSQSLAGSIHPQTPGAFSVHGASTTIQRSEHREISLEPASRDESIEIELSPISIKFDASLGFLLATVVGKLLEIVKSTHQPEVETNSSIDGEKAMPELKVLIQEISVNFMNQMGGVADNLSRSLDPAAFILSHETLLNATLQNISIHSSTKSATPSASKGKSRNKMTTVTTLQVETFRFGYETGDIISFNKTQPMSTSIRDVFLSTGWDIGIKITTSGGVSRTDIETLPLLVHLDLQRLDDTFSWFGGLSSFLNMSASMTSNPTHSTKVIVPQPAKPKGIRFELPLDPDKSAASENKVNLRVGGARLEMQGGVCSIVAETSTVKAVSRDEGIGLTIRSFRVAGPYLRNSRAEPAIIAEVNDVRLEYLATPKGPDIEQLLALVSPSNHNFVENGQDELMVDNLIMQRRKGPVLRMNIGKINIRVKDLARLDILPALGDEAAKLATVAKYLPEDDRPGLLTLGKIGTVHLSVNCGGKLGQFSAIIQTLDAAHIPAPMLVGVSAHGIEVHRNEVEELVSVPSPPGGITERKPVLRVRMIGDEIEPVVRLKLHGLAVEYRVPFIMDLLGLQDDATPQDFEAELAASVANLGDQAQFALRPNSGIPEAHKQKKPMVLNIGFHDCLIGLNPLNIPSKMVVALADAHLDVVLPNNDQTKIDLIINKSSILLIDDASIASEEMEPGQVARRKPSSYTTPQVLDLCARGYAAICYISSANAVVNVSPDADGEKQVEVEVKDELFVLETCADSTQTLITLVNALKPPTPPSKEEKYRTGVMPMEDLLSSISAEAFGNPEGEYDFDQDFAGAQEMAGNHSEAASDSGESLRIKSQYYGSDDDGEELFDAMKSSGISHGSATMQDTAEGVLLTGFRGPSDLQSDSDDDLVIHDDFYKKESTFHGTAKVWNWGRGSFDSAPIELVRRSPFKVNVQDVRFTWNLFDGYDWANTRDVITKAVQEVEQKALERHFDNDRNKVEFYEEEIEDDTIGDCLFNSIYIGIASNRDPHDLTRAINEDLNDNATETESIATTSYSGATNRTARPHQAKAKRLRLGRSRHHKITFDLQGISAHIITYPSNYEGETRSAIDVRVKSLDIIDHVHTSTWKKFATYDQDAGEREMGTSMLQLEMLNVRPMAEVVATEMVLRVKVLPLRLHVDQDALEFITRFFEFKDDKIPVHSSPSDVPFIQRVEIFDVPIKLDFKPKRVDYTGLRSGRTTEFMNFIIMDESKMVLKHIILHGISGFDRMGKMLNDLWMENVKKNQLPTVLAGLAPVKSLVNIGSGFKDLIEVPIREYKKDGRAFRSISKGAATFARNTGTELIKFGAKLAVGTQYALQGAEGMLSDQRQPQDYWDDDDLEPGERRQISLYADQPTSVMQGFRGGYRSLARDIALARDAIIAVPGEVMQSQSPGSAAAAILKRAPTIVFRPAMGVSKVVGQTLMGATNAIDPQQQRRIEEKYKKY